MRSKAIGRATNRRLLTVLIAVLVQFGSQRMASATDWRFAVRFTKSVHAAPFTGRVYIFFSRNRSEPRHDPNWFFPEQFIARDVREWKPDELLPFASGDRSVLSFPKPLADLELADEPAQAVVRFNSFERLIGDGPGNGFSQIITMTRPSTDGTVPTFVVDRLAPARKFSEGEFLKEFQVHSPLLSEFYGHDVSLKGAVLLPRNYFTERSARFPTVFIVPGFGGTHYERYPTFPAEVGALSFLRVVLDPSCPLGHHVFADSANNGPVGKALTTEFLPAFDRAYRAVADARGRFLTGHSSGGWSTLWLQVTYPEHFGGTWSTSPDPVDFRDFQQVDLYRPSANLYVDPQGRERPLARFGSRPVLYFRGFAQMENVLGRGGQLHSFEAVFSPRIANSLQNGIRLRQPQPLWDRPTGRIDPAAPAAWEKYDIRLVLERNWKEMGPKLAGKLHVFMGSEDTFYLEGATRLLKQSLTRLGSDAVIEIHPGKTHSSLLDRALRDRIVSEMAATFLKAYPNGNQIEGALSRSAR